MTQRYDIPCVHASGVSTNEQIAKLLYEWTVEDILDREAAEGFSRNESSYPNAWEYLEEFERAYYLRMAKAAAQIIDTVRSKSDDYSGQKHLKA